MKILNQIWRWIIGGHEYGDCGKSNEESLFRRHRRSGLVEQKKEFGWEAIHSDHWFKFQVHTKRRQSIQLPDRTFIFYKDSDRDRMGESSFHKLISFRRRECLECKIRKNHLLEHAKAK